MSQVNGNLLQKIPPIPRPVLWQMFHPSLSVSCSHVSVNAQRVRQSIHFVIDKHILEEQALA